MLRLLNCLFFIFLLSSCGGGGSGQEVTPPIETPLPEVTTALYGVFDLTLDNNKVRTVLLDAERSYIFSVANNSIPVQELMCSTGEHLYEFSSSQNIQTLNFNCSGSSINTLSLTIELADSVLITYTHEQEHSVTIPISDITEIMTPNFRNLSSNDYVTPIRNDIDISRYIAVSPRRPSYIDFNIFSRDWPIGGQCLASMIYRMTVFTSISVNTTNETVDVPYSQTPIFPSSGCSQKILTMPSNLEPLFTHIYTLQDNSYFVIFEQTGFLSMGRLYLSE